MRDENEYDSFFEDTMRAGHYENRKESVDIMIRSSRDIIKELIGYGVEFARKETDSEDAEDFLRNYEFTREGAHSRPRILFHEDVTGKEITGRLLAQVRLLENVTIMEYTAMTDIIVEDEKCAGVIAEDAAGDRLMIRAPYTILASGGIGGLYEHSTNYPHLTGDALRIAERYNRESFADCLTRNDTLRQLLPNTHPSLIVQPPFLCDFGFLIEGGENGFINYNCTILDTARVKFGRNILIGPNVQIYCPMHPLDYRERATGVEHGEPVTIGDDCWIGGGTVICPGVTIGNRCIIGAGSVVVKDIPDDSVAVGNPARVVRRTPVDDKTA